MRIAIIGTGIAGNVAAYHLHAEHDITVYEQNSHIGGHTHTHSLQHDDQHYNVDTGFIVFNRRTYPNFIQLLQELDVKARATEMSFSVKCERTGLEYNGNNLNTLFAQRRNLFRPSFHRMVADILRFNREASEYLTKMDTTDISLGDFLCQGHYRQQFIEQYIIPMGAAIWSAQPSRMFDFPAKFFMQFFHNHGLLSVNERPQWYVIKDGSQQYVNKLVAGHQEKIRKNCRVREVKRFTNHVEVMTDDYGIEHYDYVLFATHSDQALNMLNNPSTIERKVLSAIPYQENEAVLHTDHSILPKSRRAWASWNYHIPTQRQQRVAVSYNMNILQGLTAPHTYCVTLNYSDHIDERKIIKTVNYDHPVFTPEAVSAQSQLRDINGTQRTYYCGAYWGNGFHEDGVVSALKTLEHFNEDIENHEQLSIRRAG